MVDIIQYKYNLCNAYSWFQIDKALNKGSTLNMELSFYEKISK